MDPQSEFGIASQIYAESGLRGILLKMALTYGDGFIHDYLLSSWGFEHCTAENNIEMIYLPASDVEYIDSFHSIPQKGENAVAGVASGYWDQLRLPFEKSRVYRSFKEVFVNDSGWHQTSKYQYTYKRINSGRRSWRCDTLDDLEKRTDFLEELYRQIHDNGFKSQLELYNEDSGNKREYQTRMGDVLVPNELRIAISRNGKIIRTTHGHHRTAIMKILDKDTPIPAIIQFKHEEFSGELPYDKVTLDDTHELVEYSLLS